MTFASTDGRSGRWIVNTTVRVGPFLDPLAGQHNLYRHVGEQRVHRCKQLVEEVRQAWRQGGGVGRFAGPFDPGSGAHCPYRHVAGAFASSITITRGATRGR